MSGWFDRFTRRLGVQAWRARLKRASKHAILLDVSSRPLAASTPDPSSYFGGLPYLPDGADWPSRVDHRGEAGFLTFIGQIDLSDLPAIPGSPLPADGVLLFFVDTSWDERPAHKVIFVPPGDRPAHARPAPKGMVRLQAGYGLGGLDPTDPLHHVDVRLGIEFAAYLTYPDSPDNRPAYGWRWGDPFEEALLPLKDAAIAAAREELEARRRSRFAVRAPVVERLGYDPLSNWGFQGGPYVWEDIRGLSVSIRDRLSGWMQDAERRRAVRAEEQDADRYLVRKEDPLLLSRYWPDVVTDCQRAIEDWVAASGQHPAWQKVGPEDAAAFREAITRLNRWLVLARKRAQRLSRAGHEGPLMGAGLRAVRQFVSPMMPYDLKPHLDRDLFGLNMIRAARDGADLEALYPRALLDHRLRADDVERGISGDGNISIGVCQILGHPLTVQHAPAVHSDKLLLLQVIGGPFNWLRNSGAAYQIWIKPRDLKKRRFDRTILTFECN
jgi:hypothetical protein